MMNIHPSIPSVCHKASKSDWSESTSNEFRRSCFSSFCHHCSGCRTHFKINFTILLKKYKNVQNTLCNPVAENLKSCQEQSWQDLMLQITWGVALPCTAGARWWWRGLPSLPFWTSSSLCHFGHHHHPALCHFGHHHHPTLCHLGHHHHPAFCHLGHDQWSWSCCSGRRAGRRWWEAA